jgi:hypothetical protein
VSLPRILATLPGTTNVGPDGRPLPLGAEPVVIKDRYRIVQAEKTKFVVEVNVGPCAMGVTTWREAFGETDDFVQSLGAHIAALDKKFASA